MLVTKSGSKLWRYARYAYSFDDREKPLALGQYPVTFLAEARIKRDNTKKLLAEGSIPPQPQGRTPQCANGTSDLGDCDEPLGLDRQHRKGNPARTVDIDRSHDDLAHSANAKNRPGVRRSEGYERVGSNR